LVQPQGVLRVRQQQGQRLRRVAMPPKLFLQRDAYTRPLVQRVELKNIERANGGPFAPGFGGRAYHQPQLAHLEEISRSIG
jgi:hypothetical protein